MKWGHAVNSNRYEDLIVAYETDVDFPNVSGMEHLDMLMNRSEIARGENHLTDEQRVRLDLADQKLLQKAHQFYHAICSIADLTAWRRTCKIPAEEWWWYLDVIVQLPIESMRVQEAHPTAPISPVYERRVEDAKDHSSHL